MSTPTGTEVHCRDADQHMDARLGDWNEPIPEPVARHLEECSRCGALYGWMLEGPEPPEVPASVAEDISARLAGRLRPVRPLPSPSVLTASFVGILILALAALLTHYGTSGLRQMNLSQILVVGAVLSLAAGLISFSLSKQMFPGQSQRIPVPWLLAGFGGFYLFIVSLTFPWERVSEIFSAGWMCTYEGVLVALPVGFVLLYLSSRGAPVRYPLLGATLGAASGLLALTFLQFACGNQHAGHLLVWHGSIVALCVAAGYLTGLLVEHINARRSRDFK